MNQDKNPMYYPFYSEDYQSSIEVYSQNFNNFDCPTNIRIAVQNSMRTCNITLVETMPLGKLFQLAYTLDSAIKNARSPQLTTQNKKFANERKSLLDLIDNLNVNDAKFLSVNLKMDDSNSAKDLLLKDPDVLSFLKQMLITALERAKDSETLGAYHLNEMKSIETTRAHKAQKSVLPLTNAVFQKFYVEIKNVIRDISDYQNAKFISILLIELDCLDSQMLTKQFESQSTHATAQAYLQEKIKKKIVYKT